MLPGIGQQGPKFISIVVSGVFTVHQHLSRFITTVLYQTRQHFSSHSGEMVKTDNRYPPSRHLESCFFQSLLDLSPFSLTCSHANQVCNCIQLFTQYMDKRESTSLQVRGYYSSAHWGVLVHKLAGQSSQSPIIPLCRFEWVWQQPMQSRVCQRVRLLPVLLSPWLPAQWHRWHDLWR